MWKICSSIHWSRINIYNYLKYIYNILHSERYSNDSKLTFTAGKDRLTVVCVASVWQQLAFGGIYCPEKCASHYGFGTLRHSINGWYELLIPTFNFLYPTKKRTVPFPFVANKNRTAHSNLVSLNTSCSKILPISTQWNSWTADLSRHGPDYTKAAPAIRFIPYFPISTHPKWPSRQTENLLKFGWVRNGIESWCSDH